jgi:hypothetical protein
MVIPHRATSSLAISSHHLGILASLAHRLEVARANNDRQLIALLEQEQRQFALVPHSPSSCSMPGRSNWLKILVQRLGTALFGSTEPQIYHFANGTDRQWYARHPMTDCWIYADSEAELRLRLKQN